MINILQRVFFYVRMFLLPHIVVFALALLTGVAVSAASGLGIPVMVKYIFPVVFYTPGSGEELPKLFEHIPALETLHQENPMLVLLMACAALPLMFLLRGFTMWLNGLVVSILGVNISATVRKTVFDKLQELPISFLEITKKETSSAAQWRIPVPSKLCSPAWRTISSNSPSPAWLPLQPFCG